MSQESDPNETANGNSSDSVAKIDYDDDLPTNADRDWVIDFCRLIRWLRSHGYPDLARGWHVGQVEHLDVIPTIEAESEALAGALTHLYFLFNNPLDGLSAEERREFRRLNMAAIQSARMKRYIRIPDSQKNRDATTRAIAEELAAWRNRPPLPPISHEDWTPASKAVEFAQSCGYRISLPRLSKLVQDKKVRGRDREMPGKHQTEIELNALVEFLVGEEGKHNSPRGSKSGDKEPTLEEQNELDRAIQAAKRMKRLESPTD